MSIGISGSTQVNTSIREISRIAIPIILSISIPQIHFFTNTFFLSNYNEKALAANALAGVYFLILQMSCYGLSNGIQILMSRRAGEDNRNALGYIFSNGVYISMLFSLILITISYWAGPLLFNTMIKNQEIKTLALQFLTTRLWGLPLLILSQLCVQFYISIKATRLILYGTIVATSINIIFDYIFINGRYGMPQLGIQGAALGSVLADAGLIITHIIIILYNRLHISFNISLRHRIDKKVSYQIFNISLPIIMQYVLSIGSWELFFIYVEHLDANGDALAVSQVLRSVFGIVGLVTWGLASTCNNMVSNLIGQNRRDDVWYLIKKIALLSFSITCIIGSIILFIPEQFISIYTHNTYLISIGKLPLQVLILGTFVLSISTIFFNGALGTGNTKVNMLMEFTAITIYTLYIYFVIEKYRLSLSWAWASELVYWVVLLVLSLLYLKSGRWRKLTI